MFSQFATAFALGVTPAERKVLKDASKFEISRRQHNHRPAILQAARTQNKLYEPHVGNTNSLRGINESYLRNEKPVTGITQPHLGITKPSEGLNMSCLRNEFSRRYISLERPGKTYHLSLERHISLTIRNLPSSQLPSIIK